MSSATNFFREKQTLNNVNSITFTPDDSICVGGTHGCYSIGNIVCTRKGLAWALWVLKDYVDFSWALGSMQWTCAATTKLIDNDELIRTVITCNAFGDVLDEYIVAGSCIIEYFLYTHA